MVFIFQGRYVAEILFDNCVSINISLLYDLNLSTFLSAALNFTDDEKEQMRKLTNRSYVLDKATRYHVWLSLVDIILAYIYDVRTTEGEHNVSAGFACLSYIIPNCKELLIWLFECCPQGQCCPGLVWWGTWARVIGGWCETHTSTMTWIYNCLVKTEQPVWTVYRAQKLNHTITDYKKRVYVQWESLKL